MTILVKRLGHRFKQFYRHGPSDTRSQERALSEWYRTPLGREVVEVERQLVTRAISGRFGSTMAQLDTGLHEPLFEQRLFGLGMVVSQLENRALCPVICAQPEHLPFEPESQDMVLFHHTLDICENPYQAIREAAIALKPGGLLIILGFNPYSLWGARAFIQSRKHQASVWDSRFIRSGRVEDWMHLLDFELERHEKHLYFPPLKRPEWLKRFAFGESFLRRCLPFSGGVYLMVGYKQVAGKIHSSIKKPLSNLVEPVAASTHFKSRNE